MVLSKILMTVSVVDCVTRVAAGKRLGTTVSVDVVLRTTIGKEMGRLKCQRPRSDDVSLGEEAPRNALRE